MRLKKLFTEAIKEREKVSVDQEVLERLINAVQEGHLSTPGSFSKGPIRCRDENILFEKHAFLEDGIARDVVRLLTRTQESFAGPVDNPLLTEEQKSAVIAGLQYNMVILTGGPGTGKTFTIAQLIQTFLKNTPGKIVVAAPTGKAASHLQMGIQKVVSDKKTVASGTIHSILGIKDSYDALNKDLYLGADIIIIDECSMIDVTLWYALLRSISKQSKVVLVGDTDQLPPVETGSIFFHLCQFVQDRVPERYIHLTKCLRSESEEIIKLAHAVNSGDCSTAVRLLHEGTNIGFAKTIEFPSFPQKGTPEHLFLHANKYRVLAGLKEGEYGVHAINARFASLYGKGERWVEPIIITKSNRELGLFNGENGIAIRYKDIPEKDTAFFQTSRGEIVSFPLSILPRYELAYAISIHKSQGSEYDHITLVLQPGVETFGKELIYTGITRAKKGIKLYGTEQTLMECMSKHTVRSSTLRVRMEEVWSSQTY